VPSLSWINDTSPLGVTIRSSQNSSPFTLVGPSPLMRNGWAVSTGSPRSVVNELSVGSHTANQVWVNGSVGSVVVMYRRTRVSSSGSPSMLSVGVTSSKPSAEPYCATSTARNAVRSSSAAPSSVPGYR